MNEKDLADRLQAGLAKPLGAALRSAVERQLLPSLERAVGEAFRQVRRRPRTCNHIGMMRCCVTADICGSLQPFGGF